MLFGDNENDRDQRRGGIPAAPGDLARDKHAHSRLVSLANSPTPESLHSAALDPDLNKQRSR